MNGAFYDRNDNIYALEPAVGLGELHDLTLDDRVALRQPGHDTNLIVNFDDPFCFPCDLFVKHLLDIQANRAISYDVSFLYGEVDFRFPQT